MNNLPLFDRWQKPEHIGAPYAIGSDTSREAAASIAKRIAYQRADVYTEIARSGADGRTWDEIVAILGCSPTSNGRITELRDGGDIVDSGRRRRTRTGRNAVVWIAAPKREAA